MGVEAFAEVARLLFPDWHVTAVENVNFREPVKFYRDQPRTVRISAVFAIDEETGDLVARCQLIGTRTLPNRPEPQVTVHFTGQVRLTAEPAPTESEAAVVQDGQPFVAQESVYAIYFHGPRSR